MRKTLLFFILALLFSSCGRKTALIPRSELSPLPVYDLRVMGREDRAILVWTVPEKDIRGSSIKNVKQFTILRDAAPIGAPPCQTCTEHYKVISTFLPSGEKQYFDGGTKIEFFDSPLTYGTRYRYKVIPVTDQGRSGKESPVAVLDWIVPPAPPEDLRGLPGDRYSLLSWKNPEILVDGSPLTGVTGYSVYRREDGGTYSLYPVNSFPVTETTYTDGGLENHKQYFYTVRTLVGAIGSLIEGPPSNEILLVPRRLDLPSRPEGVAAACIKGGIDMTWKKSDDPEVIGYNVYKRKKGETRVKKLNTTPVELPHYGDTGIRRQTAYFYSVRAVEGPPLGRESLPSDEVSVSCR